MPDMEPAEPVTYYVVPARLMALARELLAALLLQHADRRADVRESLAARGQLAGGLVHNAVVVEATELPRLNSTVAQVFQLLSGGERNRLRVDVAGAQLQI